MSQSVGIIKKVSGPLVVASGMRDANMFDVVHVSRHKLIGEIIEMHGIWLQSRYMKKPPDWAPAMKLCLLETH